MLEWLEYNVGSVILSIALASGVAALVVRLIKQKKSGKSSCGCGCQGCAMKGCCNKGKQ